MYEFNEEKNNNRSWWGNELLMDVERCVRRSLAVLDETQL